MTPICVADAAGGGLSGGATTPAPGNPIFLKLMKPLFSLDQQLIKDTFQPTLCGSKQTHMRNTLALWPLVLPCVQGQSCSSSGHSVLL